MQPQPRFFLSMLPFVLLFACTRSSPPTVSEDESACAKGDPASCERRLNRMKAACETKSVKECVDVADAYATPVHAPKDDAQAAIYYEKACNLNDARSCALLANQRWAGRGTTRDPNKALELDERACTLGYAESCKEVAACLETADVVKGCTAKDLKKARDLWARWCELEKTAKSDCAELKRVERLLGNGG